MSLHKLSILGYLASAFAIITFTVRYLIIYWDISQFLQFAFIGVLIGILAYFYNWMREQDMLQDAQDKRLDAIVDFFMNRQKDAILEQAGAKE